MRRSGLLCVLAGAVLALTVIVAAPAAGQGLAPQCSDGVDNDGDGLTDWPDDPQCVKNPDGTDPDPFSSDNSEADEGYQGFSGTPPPDGGGGGGGDFGAGPCETTKGPATISDVFAKKAGGGWEPYAGQCRIEFQEQPDPSGGTMSFLALSFTDQTGNQDLKSLYPNGTQISAHISSAGQTPLFVLASGTDVVAGDAGPSARALGQSFTAQLTVPTVEFSTQQGPPPYSCAPGTTQTMDFAGLVVQYQSSGGIGDLMNAFDGFVVGGTFQAISFDPQALSAQGDIGVTTEGCGNVITQITVPSDGLALGGMTQSLMNTLNSQIGDEAPDLANLNDLVDNNEPVPPKQFDSEFLTPSELAPEPVPGTRSRLATRSAARKSVGAVGIDYRSGAGSHGIETAPDTTAVKAAKKAVKKCKGGKLKVKRGKFVCKRRR